MTLLLVSVVSVLSMTIAIQAQQASVAAANSVHIQRARLNAESGLSYLNYLLESCPVTAGLKDAALMARVRDCLADTIPEDKIQYDDGNTTLSITSMDVATGGTFSAVLTMPDSQSVHVAAVGNGSGVSRSAGVNFELTGGSSTFFANGVATNGTIDLRGNAAIHGSVADATVLSATTSDEGVRLTGNACIAGYVNMTNGDGHVSVSGNNATIAGQNFKGNTDQDTINGDPQRYQAFDFGVGNMDFPAVDTSAYRPLATTTLTKKTNKNVTVENIFIPRNTDPTFSGNSTLNGVIYIEEPNNVTFSGNITITGVIVSDVAPEGEDYGGGSIKFTGNTTTRSVGSLPNQPQFAQLKQMPGSFLLAPDFAITLSGNFNTAVMGAMAGKSFDLGGNPTLTVKGGIYSYGTADFSMGGNASITIDRSGMPDQPPGFAGSTVFKPNALSYLEH